jgi:hypothetical protein
MRKKKHSTRNDAGQLHSIDDAPALETKDGAKFWYKDGKCHRDNGEPAYYSPERPYADTTLPEVSIWFIRGIELTNKQVKLLKKINATEIQHLPWLLNEDELLNSVIEKRMNEKNR